MSKIYNFSGSKRNSRERIEGGEVFVKDLKVGDLLLWKGDKTYGMSSMLILSIELRKLDQFSNEDSRRVSYLDLRKCQVVTNYDIVSFQLKYWEHVRH